MSISLSSHVQDYGYSVTWHYERLCSAFTSLVSKVKNDERKLLKWKRKQLNKVLILAGGFGKTAEVAIAKDPWDM